MIDIPLRNSLYSGIYPERKVPRLSKTDQFTAAAGGLFAQWLRPRTNSFKWIIEILHKFKA